MPQDRNTSQRSNPRTRCRSLSQLAWVSLATTALAGCSVWNLGPEPDAHVRPSGNAQSLTDPELHAVLPVVAGDTGESIMSATMPAATEPTTTRPAAGGAGTSTTLPNPALLPSLGVGSTTQSADAIAHGSVPKSLSVQEAILTGLLNNSSLKVQRYNVPIRRTNEEQAASQFDPTVTGTVQGGASGASSGTTNSIAGSIGVQEFFPTGTTISTGLSTSNNFYSDASSSTGVTLSVTQSLLRGAGLDVNLATLREAELQTKITQYELRGFAESLIASIETTYWDLAFAERQVIIVQNSLNVAQSQLDETNSLIRVERLAQSERASAEAEVALRRQELINAKSALETTRIKFLQLITPPGEPFWNRTIELHTQPFIPQGDMDSVDKHADVAMKFRPEINQANLQIQRGDLEIVRTKNGLLPRLDIFVTLGQTGFANSFGESITQLNGPNYQTIVGVTGDWQPLNRSARASYRASVLSKDQLEETMRNLVQTVEVDVRTQYIEVERTRQQIDATRATRVASQTAYETELAKFRAQRSTSLLVAQTQRDLLSAQLSEVQAVTNHLKSLVTLYRLEGSLLYRRGIEAPGAAPAQPQAWRK